MTHPIPDAIDYLVTKIGPQLGDMQVVDGPPVVELANSGVTFGYAVDRLAVEIQKPTEGALSGGLGGGDGITFDINCMTWYRTGDDDMKAIRDQTFLQLATIDDLLHAGPTLGGAVMRAQLRLADYDQLQTQEDSWGTVAFVITCNAFH